MVHQQRRRAALRGARSNQPGPFLTNQAAQRPVIADPAPHGPGWLGPLAVLSALASALATFLVLAGLTPILPTHEVVVKVFAINGALVLLLSGIVAWQSKRLMRERRAGAAGSGLHIRIVGLFSLVAVLPAILVAFVGTRSEAHTAELPSRQYLVCRLLLGKKIRAT